MTLGVGELAGAAVDTSAAPFLAVGNTAVDLTPEWLKSWAISTFGENDKMVLLIGMGVVLAVVSAAGGLLELWRRWWGIATLLALGVAAVLAALGRPVAGPAWALPTIAGVVVGAPTLHLLVSRLRMPEPAAGSGEASAGLRHHRRRFLLLTTAAAGLAVPTAAGGRRFGQARAEVLAARDRLRLPAPADPGPRIPADVILDVDGITPFRTPNSDFYRVDINLDVPEVRPDEWRLRVHGMVDHELELTYDDLLGLDLVERMITLTCVSNQVGGDLAGNARWLGYPLTTLLERAGPRPDADMVLSTSVDGFTIGTPLQALTDGRDALLAIGMNDEPLPLEHGFPARMVVPGLYGYVSATKWVTNLEVTRFDRATAYWTDRDWAERAPIKTASRIDVPGSFAELAEEATVDAWRQWFWQWDATETGNHTLRVRATDATVRCRPRSRLRRSRRVPADGIRWW